MNFFKEHQNDIILLTGVFLISLLSFAVGYIVAEQKNKEPIKIEYEEQKSSYHRGGDMWTLSSSKTITKRI